MIARLCGHVVHQELDQLIIDVNGVGYLVSTPLGSSSRLALDDGRCIIHIHTAVREDAIALYGFPTTREKRVFSKLISVSGVGPKLGLAVLSALTVDELIAAVEDEAIAQLTRVSGVGKKTAQRLLLELKGLLADVPRSMQATQSPASPNASLLDDLRSVLQNLGYKPGRIEDVIDKIQPIPEDVNSIEPLIRKALKLL